MALRAGAPITDHTNDLAHKCHLYHNNHIQRYMDLRDNIQRRIQETGGNEAVLHISSQYSIFKYLIMTTPNPFLHEESPILSIRSDATDLRGGERIARTSTILISWRAICFCDAHPHRSSGGAQSP